MLQRSTFESSKNLKQRTHPYAFPYSGYYYYPSFSKAQMDRMFYQPKKEMKALEFKNIENDSLPVGSDTITAVVLKPESTSIKKLFCSFTSLVATSQRISTSQTFVEDGFQVVIVVVRGYGNQQENQRT